MTITMISWRAGWRRDFAAILMIAVVWLVFYWPLFTPAEAQRVQIEPGDFTLQFLAFRQFALDELHQGHWPLWMPCVDSGYPYFADPQSASFYPPAVINLGVHVAAGANKFSIVALELEAALHALLAAVGTYGFLRGETASRIAALIGTLAFTFGGYLTGYPVLQLAILESAAWLPWTLWATRRLIACGDGRSTVLAALPLTMSVLAGHPQTVLMSLYMMTAYGLYRVWRAHHKPGRGLIRLAVSVILAGLLSAIQLVPSLEFMGLSSRASLTPEIAGTGFALSEIVQLVAPNVGSYHPLYVGLLPLGLAILAIGWAVNRRRRPNGELRGRDVIFWSIVALIALLVSFGRNLPVFDLFYWLAPGYRLFRDQERHAFIFSWAMSILAAFGVSLILSALAAYFRRPLRKWAVAAIAVVIVMADLISVNRTTNWVRPYEPFPSQPALETLKADAPAGILYRLHNEQRLPGHAACVAGLNEVGGITPIHIDAYQQFIRTVPREVRWQLLNVVYVMSWRSVLDGSQGQPIHSELLLQTGEGKDATYTYRLNDEHPRSWIVHKVEMITDRDKINASLAAPEFDPYQQAFASTPVLVADATGTEQTSIGALESNRLSLDATLATPGLLVLSEMYYPGWVATVNGVEAPVLIVNGILRGLVLAAGTSHVEMMFQPRSFLIGGIGSIIGLCLWLGLVIGDKHVAGK